MRIAKRDPKGTGEFTLRTETSGGKCLRVFLGRRVLAISMERGIAMITAILEITTRILVGLLDLRDGLVDWLQYMGEEIRNEGADWAAFDTQELRRVQVSRNLRRPYDTQRTYEQMHA